MPDLGVWEILIIAVVVLVLFGSKKLPDSARSLGRSLRIFKSETKGLMDDDQPKAAHEAKLRDEAAKLREQAAALEAQAQASQAPSPQGLPAGEGATLNGVPLSKADQANRTS
ncbi:MAG: twin-arginine translocation protein TatA/E family [Streptosporangiaceae bacterium]|jgi:sec-independent protein translocase protein TatA|nr:twin-arginine translocation protein TatA/E family [Streptosporangiaceae bacterium]